MSILTNQRKTHFYTIVNKLLCCCFLFISPPSLHCAIAKDTPTKTDKTTILKTGAIVIEFTSLNNETLSKTLINQLSSNIRNHLSISQQSCEAPIERLHALNSKSHQEIETALNSLGFYYNTISIHYSRNNDDGSGDSDNQDKKNSGNNNRKTEDRTSADNCWQASTKVTLSPRVLFEDVAIDISGPAIQKSDIRRYLSKAPIKKGMPLLHETYDVFKKNLLKKLHHTGYLDATYTLSELRIDLKKLKANITLELTSGEQYHFGKISHSDTFLNDSFVDAFLESTQNQPFTQEALLDLNRELSNTGYFKTVGLRPLIEKRAQQTVPLTIDLAMRRRKAYELGAGFATDTGVRALFGVENRFLNRKGHKLENNLLLSELRSDIDGTLTIPLKSNPSRRSLKFSTTYENEKNDTSQEIAWRTGIAYSYLQPSNWLRTIGIKANREAFSVGNQSGVSTLFVPYLSWSRSKSNHWSYPTRGWRIEALLQGASNELLSDTSFVQTWISGKRVFQLWPRRPKQLETLLPSNEDKQKLSVKNNADSSKTENLTKKDAKKARLILRAEVGFTKTDTLADIPTSLRYFTGGDNSIRGYGYKTLGTRNAEEEVIGGSQLLVSSAEIDYLIWKQMGIAAFIDSGNAFEGKDFTAASSIGLGLRWFSPIGPIRLDLAKGLDLESTWRLHLSMGPDL